MPDLITMSFADEGVVGQGYRISPEELVTRIERDRPDNMAVDSESPTFVWHREDAIPFAITFAWRTPEGEIEVAYLDCFGEEKVIACVHALEKIFLLVPNLVFHNAKYDMHVLSRLYKQAGVPLLARKVHCTMLMDYVVDEYRTHALKPLSKLLGLRWGQVDPEFYRDQVDAWLDTQEQLSGIRPGFHEVPAEIMDPYAVNDAVLTLMLYEALKKDIEAQTSQTKKRRDVVDSYLQELECMWVCWSAEERGMRIDIPYIYQRIAEMRPEVEDIRARVKELVGWDVNVGSGDDMSKVLQSLGVPAYKLVNPQTGRTKMPEWVIEDLRRDTDDPKVKETCKAILTYRENTKILGTYFEALIAQHYVEEGQAIIHCNIKQHGARTARMSVTDPPLQTIPRTKGNVREAFISREGHIFTFADYEQQELRVLAHFMRAMGDESMYEIFCRDGDVHWETAEAVHKKPRDQMSKGVERQAAKDTNFGVVYGMGAKKAAATIGQGDIERGKVFLRDYNEKFPGLAALRKQTEKAMATRGFIVTPFGRRHREKNARFAYKAINSLVQGTSAELTKAAMIAVHNAFAREGMRSQILLMVHDEIITESPVEEAAVAAEIIRREMTMGFEEIINVPLAVDIAQSDRWSSKG